MLPMEAGQRGRVTLVAIVLMVLLPSPTTGT